jgi:putative redox protein
MTHQIKSKFTEGMAFETELQGHKIIVDAEEQFGGHDKGPMPKPLLLKSLSGCTGMDVLSLLKKMRVEHKDFSIEVEGTLSEEHPKYYTDIHLTYNIRVKPEDHAKVTKAVALSQERYCGVSYMLSKSSRLSYEINFEEL